MAMTTDQPAASLAACEPPCTAQPEVTASRQSSEESGTTSEKVKLRQGPFRRGGTFPTSICLSKAAIGAGVLSMSVHCAEVGLYYQVAALIFGAVLNMVSIRMIAWASVQTGRWSYEDVCEDLFHPAMSLLTGSINVCNCIGSGAGYLIVCGQVFQVLTGTGDAWRRRFVVLVGVCVCGPLALARHVGFMRHLAALSVAALLLLVGVVAWFMSEHGADETINPSSIWFGSGGATVLTYMNSINNVVFAYNNQFNVPQLTGELTPEPSVDRMTVVAAITTVFCFLLYAGVSVLGLLAFGVGDNQRDSLVVDLTPERRHPFVIIAMAAVMFSVLTCFQFHVYPIRQFAAYSVRKVRGRGVEDEKFDAVVLGITLTRWYDMASAITSVMIIILVAVVVTSLKNILDFVGAFAAAYIAYVVPPLWVIQVRRKQEGFSWFTAEIAFCLGFFGLGMFFFVFGTYSAVAGAFDR